MYLFNKREMKKIIKLTTFSFLVLFGFSCTNNDNEGTDTAELLKKAELLTACDVDNPVEDLDWLKAEIEDREQNKGEFYFEEYQYISMGIYKNEVLFFYGNCCPVCNSVINVYNCKGELVGTVGYDETKFIPFDALFESEFIWKADNFACTDYTG